MVNFFNFTRKFLYVKLIKIKPRLAINYKDSQSGLTKSNKGIIDEGMLAGVAIRAKISKNYDVAAS